MEVLEDEVPFEKLWYFGYVIRFKGSCCFAFCHMYIYICYVGFIYIYISSDAPSISEASSSICITWCSTVVLTIYTALIHERLMLNLFLWCWIDVRRYASITTPTSSNYPVTADIFCSLLHAHALYPVSWKSMDITTKIRLKDTYIYLENMMESKYRTEEQYRLYTHTYIMYIYILAKC